MLRNHPRTAAVIATLCCQVTFTTGCGDEDADALPWEGRYITEGSWDLSGPLANRRSVGEFVADELVGEVVDRAGVPSFVRGEVKDAVEAALHAPLRAAIDARMPPELADDSPVVQALSATLGGTEFTSQLVLRARESNARKLDGSQEILELSVEYEGVRVALPLSAASDSVTLSASLSGELVGDQRMEIGPHRFELRYGGLVIGALEAVVGRDDTERLLRAVSDAVNCEELVDVATGGGDAFGLRVAGQGISVGAEHLTEVCERLHDEADARALGLFGDDTGLELSGMLQLEDTDSDLRIDTVQTEDGYGGTLSGPAPFVEGVVGVEFSGARMSDAR